MSRYRAMVKCFVDNSLRNEGEVFEYNGPKNNCLEPADEPEAHTGKKGGHADKREA